MILPALIWVLIFSPDVCLDIWGVEWNIVRGDNISHLPASIIMAKALTSRILWVTSLHEVSALEHLWHLTRQYTPFPPVAVTAITM
jgi:hypothetical protein